MQRWGGEGEIERGGKIEDDGEEDEVLWPYRPKNSSEKNGRDGGRERE